MDRYLLLSPEERRVYCEQAAADLGLPAASIEKDFWVCWILKELFSLPGIGEHLTFKGGTSLSKGWGLIQRFSEDIDIVISRSRFGVTNGPERDSAKAWKQYLEMLSEKTRDFIVNVLMSNFRDHLASHLPESMQWKLIHELDDSANEVVLFHYPPIFPEGGYLRPVVRIEPGARSDTVPTERRPIEAFLTGLLKAESFLVRCVHPKRTF
nr:nucleotidyl transferase AbiEii/AbiGii toxin family protein [Candidatus Hydrogenedentota bacterium]